MTQDCLDSPSTADVSYRLPKGIHVTGADDKSNPALEGMSWSHLRNLRDQREIRARSKNSSKNLVVSQKTLIFATN